MCVRLPHAGPTAIIVTESQGQRARASAVLGDLGLSLPVEVASRHTYNERVLRLVEALSAKLPDPARMSLRWEVLRDEGAPALHPSHAYSEAAVEGSQCPRAVVQVGPRHGTRQRDLAWAMQAIRRYGQDRVAYAFNAMSRPD